VRNFISGIVADGKRVIKAMLEILMFIILIVFLFDFTKIRQQNQMMIHQNERIISLLEEIKKN